MTLLELLSLLRKHLRLVVALPLICALAAAAVCWTALPNVYTANVSMYVLTKSSTEAGVVITNNDLTASQMLTNDVAQLVKSDRVMREASAALDLPNLDDFDLEVTSSTTTRVLGLAVTGTSQADVARVANQLAKTTDVVAQDVMDLQSVNVMDKAQTPQAPSGPKRLMYTAVALLAGLFIAVALVVLMDMLNTRVRTPEEAADLVGLPLIGRIPVIRS